MFRSAVNPVRRSSLVSRYQNLSFRSKNVRFGSSLVFLEHHNNKITPASSSLLTAATELKKPIVGMLLGSNSKQVAEELSKTIDLPQLQKLLISNDKSFDNYLSEPVSKILKDTLSKGNYDNFLMSSNTVGKNILPRVASVLNIQPICDVTKIVNPTTFHRPIYAGNLISTIESKQEKRLLSIRTSLFKETQLSSTNDKNVNIEELPNFSGNDRKTIWERNTIATSNSDIPDLMSSKRVVAGGFALRDKDTFETTLYPLAKTLNASIGATRAAVDSGFCDNSLQIGQTGKNVAPDLYIAVGLSGAIQHLAGMKNSKYIVAINNDSDAPIFKVADYSLRGDLFEIVPDLTKKLQELKT